MFVLQHLWSQWTKPVLGFRSRRSTLPEALPLPPPTDKPEAWVHDARRIERERFKAVENAGPLTLETWRASSPAHPANLSWKAVGDELHIFLSPPWPGLLRSPWPTDLAAPLTVLRPGDIAKIDWNARFANSLAGYDRGYYFAEHRYWLANVDAPGPDLFTNAASPKHVDLRIRM